MKKRQQVEPTEHACMTRVRRGRYFHLNLNMDEPPCTRIESGRLTLRAYSLVLVLPLNKALNVAQSQTLGEDNNRIILPSPKLAVSGKAAHAPNFACMRPTEDPSQGCGYFRRLVFGISCLITLRRTGPSENEGRINSCQRCVCNTVGADHHEGLKLAPCSCTS